MKHIVELNQLWKPGFGIVLVGFGLLLSFQNCSKVNFTEGSVTPIQVAGATVDVVCDPFNVSGTCDPTSTKGLIGNVYHLPGEYDSVDRYISSGQKLDIYVQMSNLNIPTRSWSSGFPTSAGSTLKDAKGEALIEFFALDLKGAFVLTSNQTEGAYDFGVAADDGLILDIDGKTIVNNDGSHGRSWKCSSQSVSMKIGESHPVRVRYFQGPRLEIALQVYMRPVSKRGQPCDDSGGWTIVPAEMLRH